MAIQSAQTGVVDMSYPARGPRRGIDGKANGAERRHPILDMPLNFEEAEST